MKLKTAIVGFGGMGHYHAERISKKDNYEFCGIYDTDPDVCLEASGSGIKVFANPEEIVSGGVEAVILAVPNDVHAEYSVYFATRGVAVLCEKPVMMSSKELERVAGKVSGGAVFTIHQNRRTDPDYLTVKKIISDGTLGGVYRLESHVVGGNGIPGGWRKEKAHGGGMMLDWGVHLIDQILLLPTGKITSVNCRYSYVTGYEVDDGFDLELLFDSGLSVNIVVDTNTFIPSPRWRVFGYGGTAEITTWDLKGKIVKPKPLGDYVPVGMEAGNGFTKTMAYKLSEETETLPLPEIVPNPDYIYDNFVSAVKSGAETVVKISEAMRVMRVMETAAESARKGKTITGLKL